MLSYSNYDNIIHSDREYDLLKSLENSSDTNIFGFSLRQRTRFFAFAVSLYEIIYVLYRTALIVGYSVWIAYNRWQAKRAKASILGHPDQPSSGPRAFEETPEGKAKMYEFEAWRTAHDLVQKQLRLLGRFCSSVSACDRKM